MSEPTSPRVLDLDDGSTSPPPEPSPDREEPKRHELLSVSRGSSTASLQQRNSLKGRKQPAGTGAAVLHNTDLAKIANEEWQALLKGEKYYCQLVVGGSSEARDVILNVNLSGIKLLDRKNETVINQFDIEQILQYSYSQQNSTFSFSYLEEGRFFVTHKFISKDYFDIHQYLGNAIAIVIKLKTQIKKNGPSETLNMIDNQRNERSHSIDTLRRSSRAKQYFEQKYRNRGPSSPTEGSAEDSARSSFENPPASPRAADGKSAGAHLQSLFAPPGATASNSAIATAPATSTTATTTEAKGTDGGKQAHVQQEYRKYKEYIREGSSDATNGGDEATAAGSASESSPKRRPGTIEIQLKDPELPLESEASQSSVRTSESSASISSMKSQESIRQKSGKSMNWSGSLRLGKNAIQDMMGSMRGVKTNKPTSKVPSTPEDMERERKRMTMFEGVDINVEELPEQQIKVDANGRPRLIKSMVDGQYHITTGTIDGLVEALADENAPDTLFIDDFLLTYRVFVSSSVLFDKLAARYNLQPTVTADDKSKSKKDKQKTTTDEKKTDETVMDANTVSLIRARVLSVFKKWVDRHWYDFEPAEMREKLNTLIMQIKASDYAIVSQQLLNFIAQNEKRKQLIPPEPSPFPPSTPGSVIDFINMDPKLGPMQVAKHMCNVSIKLFKQIQPDEFAIHLWSKKDQRLQQEMTKNLNRFIDRFNNLGYWVASELCAVSNLQKRIIVMERFIQIAKNLFKLQNYNDLIAVMSGLNTIPIYRLKKTWAGASKEMIAKFRDLEARMSPENNYKQYRAIEFAAKGDMIPFFALTIKDLVFYNDGNQTFLPNDMINFEKNRSVMGKIMAIRVWQQSKYEFENLDDKIIQYLEAIHHQDEDQLTEESYRLEPSNRRRAASISESINSEVSISTVDTEETAVSNDMFDNASTAS